MYEKAYGIIETCAPVHVGASAGEETGNLNLIFRDPFLQTGMIPGSSIRGRFRADMRWQRQRSLETNLKAKGVEIPPYYETEFEIEVPESDEEKSQKSDTKEGESEKEPKLKKVSRLKWLEHQAEQHEVKILKNVDENHWYGHEAVRGKKDSTTEALVKFEYASLLWLPVFCPGQPIVWVSCPQLLKRYKSIAKVDGSVPKPEGETYPVMLPKKENRLFFSLGFIDNLQQMPSLNDWVPKNSEIAPDRLVVVNDADMASIHEMALYRQSRVRLDDTEKKVAGGAFFNVEALPEGSILAFPVALKQEANVEKKSDRWDPFNGESDKDLYMGGLESIGFGRCKVTLRGNYFQNNNTK